MIAKDSLLLMLAAVAVSLGTTALPVSAVTCSIGKDLRTPVSNRTVLNLRQGETLILNCKGNPVETGEHFTIYDTYPGTLGLIWKNESSLNYTWYIEATEDGPLHILHFFSNSSYKVVFELTIQVHNLDLLIEMRPCTTPSPKPTAPPTDDQQKKVNSAGVQQETQSPSETSTTNVGNTTAMTKFVEMYVPYFVVCVVLVLVLLLVFCFACLIMIYCRKGQSSKLSQAEQGQRRRVGGDEVCGQSHDVNNSQDESTISLGGSNSEFSDPTHNLTADPSRPEPPQAHSADLQANTRELQLPAKGQRSRVEEGQGNGGDKVCENQLSDTNSSRDESTVQDTSLASSNSNQDVFDDHNTSTQHLNE